LSRRPLVSSTRPAFEMFGSYLWHFSNWSMMPVERTTVESLQELKLFSPVFSVYGRQFKMQVWPFGARSQDFDYIAIDVLKVSSEDVDCICICNATVLRTAAAKSVPVSASGAENRLQIVSRIFSKVTVTHPWGAWRLAARRDVLDRGQGYNCDGCLAVLVDIELVNSYGHPMMPPKPVTTGRMLAPTPTLGCAFTESSECHDDHGTTILKPSDFSSVSASCNGNGNSNTTGLMR
jgi:hypothetical protein